MFSTDATCWNENPHPPPHNAEPMDSEAPGILNASCINRAMTIELGPAVHNI